MAQIVTITNPLTGQPAQVDQLDHTAQQIDDAVTRAIGYGLGAANVNGASYDANNCVKNGWYNCNVNTPTVSWWYILTVANYGNAVVVQKAWHYNGGKVVECMRLGWLDKAEDQGGGWQPWEWVNPPMNPGTEYRTTERYLGKPVYVQNVNVGNLPVATIKTVDLDTTARIFECKGFINVNNQMTIPARNINGGSEYIDVYGNYNHIKIVTSNDRSTWGAIVTAKYTKTTD